MLNDNKILSAFKIQNNRFMFYDQNLSARDSMFLCYYCLQTSRFDMVKDFLLQAESDTKSHSNYFDRVLWLWSLGEYVHKSKDRQLINQFDDTIDYFVKDIEARWDKPMGSWINADLPADVYLSNLSLAYGALLSINNEFKREELVVLMKKIKEYMFKRLMKGSRVTSKISDDVILGDIGLAAVPFAMVDAGNQILVEAVAEVEKKLISKGVRLSISDTYYGGCVRNELTLFLAWYYSEKGDMAKAKGLLVNVSDIYNRDGKLYELVTNTCKEDVLYMHWVENMGEVKESSLAYILYAITEQNIVSKEKSSDTSVKTGIIHTGAGNGNPYITEVTERYPRYPQEGEIVTLRAITQPFNDSQELKVLYWVNGSDENKKTMTPLTAKSGEKVWEVQLGCFNAHDKVTYKFELTENSGYAATSDNVSDSITSNSYEFLTGKWVKLSQIKAIEKRNDSIIIYFEKVDSINGIPCLEIQDQNNRLKYNFKLKNEYPIELINRDCDYEEVKIGLYIIKVNHSKKSLIICDKKGTKVFETHSAAKYLELLTDGSGEIKKLRFNLSLSPEERIFGTGERYSHFELRGQNVDNYVYNQYRDQGLRSYLPIPFIVSSKGYGLYLDTTFYARFSFGTKLSDMLEIEVDMNRLTQEMDIYIFNGHPKEMLQAYSDVVGKPHLPPKWSFGPWMSSNNWDSQKEACRQVDLTIMYEIPSTVIVLEQWSDEATFYIFNDSQYQVKDGNEYLKFSDYRFPEWGRWPDPRQMVEDFHADGLKVLLWQAPVMKYMDGVAHAQRDEDERVMLQKGYHIKHKDGTPYNVPYYEWFKRSLIPDFTNPQAGEWWLNKRLYLVDDIGIDGFKTDGGECVYGDDLVFYDGTPGAAMRNGYPNSYIGSYFEFTKKHTNGQGITFSRAGYTGAHRIPLHWAGDERSTFKAFVSSIKAGLSGAMSGLTFWGWDMAGFNGDIPTAELYLRSTEMAVFCPVMQYHAETKGEFNQDRTPWNIAERTGVEDVIRIYKKYADLRMNILPYIYNQAVQSCQSGIPLMRPMYMEYPEDSRCVDMYTQYMFGENLLVAPVIEEGSTIKDVYLPAGSWQSLFDDKIYEGENLIRIQSEINQIPVFIKENSIIPLNLSDDFSLFSHVSNDVTNYVNLCFMIFIKDSIEFLFKDDLGYEILFRLVKDQENVEIKTEFLGKRLPITFILTGIANIKDIIIDGKVSEKRAYGVNDGWLVSLK